MSEDDEGGGRPIIGGRHGSPTINVAFPFSSVRTGDADLREAMTQLAGLVAELAETDKKSRRAAIAQAARDIASQLRERE
ncbi:MAG TPA: hypothetical protein VMW08_03580 [Acidimicrobiales bacterium]|nr:hypothetical protein [Acidimicrobiales bacterium]